MIPGERTAFPTLQAQAYLNHAAIGPLPQATVTAIHAACLAQATQGVAAVADLIAAADAVRTHAAALTGHASSDVALTGNTSHGVTAIAQGLPWKAGDRIVLFEGEFPTNTTPWQVAAQAFGLALTWLPLTGVGDGSGDFLARLEQVLRQGVRLVAVSAVQFRSGLRMPVEAMAARCHAHGAALFVDAIQGLGAVPMDLSQADYVSCGGQKWLMGPIGTGFVTMRPGPAQALRPTLASWLSHEDPLAFLFEGPGRLTYDRPLATGRALLEGGSANLAGHVGLATSMAIQRQIGPAATHAHATAYLDALEPALQAMGFRSHRAQAAEARSNILSLTPPPGWSAADVASGLADRGVSVSTPDGLLRLSPSWPNPRDECDLVTEALRDVLASR